MPAGVPGIPEASVLGDRLHSRRAGCASCRLKTSPRRAGAGRRGQDSSNGRLAKSGAVPTRATEAQTGVTSAATATSQWEGEDPSPRQDPRQRRRDMLSRCQPEAKALYKVPLPERSEDG
jgi:hypothetical protein